MEVLVKSIFSFASTITASIILIAPFIFSSMDTAPTLAFIIGIIMAFILGGYVGIISRENPYISGLKYAILAVVGAVISHIIADLFQLAI